MRGETLRFREFYAYYGQMLQQPVKNISKGMANIVELLAKLQNRELKKSLKWYFEREVESFNLIA